MSSDSSVESNDSFNLHPRRRRDNLSPEAREYLRQWIRDHIHDPYPTDDEKATFALMLNLTPLQVNNWFINARRRDVPKIRIEMGLPAEPTNNNTKRASKRRYVPHMNTGAENDRRSRLSMSSTHSDLSLLKMINPHSSLDNKFDEMNLTLFESEYNLKLLSLAALIHDSHC